MFLRGPRGIRTLNLRIMSTPLRPSTNKKLVYPRYTNLSFKKVKFCPFSPAPQVKRLIIAGARSLHVIPASAALRLGTEPGGFEYLDQINPNAPRRRFTQYYLNYSRIWTKKHALTTSKHYLKHGGTYESKGNVKLGRQAGQNPA